jgi:hypothetical protein
MRGAQYQKNVCCQKTCPYLTLSTIVATGHIHSVVMGLHEHNIHTFVNKNLSQCLIHDESHHLFIGLPPFWAPLQGHGDAPYS